MNCAGFEALAGDLVRDRIPAGREWDAAFAHAEECSRCGLRLVDERALAADLRALALGTERAEAPERVERALLAAWREQGMEPVAAEALRFPSKRPTWLWGAAAALLLSAGVAMLGRPAPPAPPAPAPFPAASGRPIGESAAVAPTEAPTTPEPTAAPPLAAPRASPVANAPRVAAGREVNDGMTAGFTPLDGTYGLEDLETAHVVRVRLSPAALVALGWPIAEDEGEMRLVSADVVVAEDGIARAIRLVE